MGQYSCQMSEKALVDSQEALGLDCTEQTIECAVVEVASLVVHAAHDRVGRMHDAADDESRRGTASQMQSWAFFHTQVPDKPSLREEVCGELD